MSGDRHQDAVKTIEQLYSDITRRAGVSPFGSCPVDLTAAFVRLCLAQSCGKCVPCRIGLSRILSTLEGVLDGQAADFDSLRREAQAIYDSADCAIGFEAAKLVLDGLAAFQDDYLSHGARGVCTEHFASVPCQEGCPAHVDIPGYIACLAAGRPADAVRVIRRDNPFPAVCGLVCEHPCESHCRRNVVDAPVNVRALKRAAVERAGDVPVPASAPATGKRVGIVGGGPAGLSAAYYLARAGVAVTVCEKRPKLGGMLRYGIPAYRLPDADLDRDIAAILSAGVCVKTGVAVGEDISFADFRGAFDAVYLSIGAHGAKSLRLPGEDAEGVLSAVAFLAEPHKNPLAGKRVVVVGGGNVAMDATRTARRLGASRVTCVYRRRIEDMTALPDEIAGAQAEGCEIVPLMAPVRVETAEGRVTGLVVQPQIPGPIKEGRPSPQKAARPEATIPCDVIVSAVGQRVDATGLELAPKEGVFIGGDCDYGPSTVIRAIDAGKRAAAEIAAFCGLSLAASEKVEIPAIGLERLHWGRVNPTERSAEERRGDFALMENSLTDEEVARECSRCLRCDRCGRSLFRRERA